MLQTPVRHQLPAPLLPMLRTAARRLPEQVVARIAVEVPVLVERERMRPVVSDAVAVAVLGFFEGGGACAATARFHEFGRAQAESGASVVPVLQALQAAASVAWELLHRLARHEGLAGHVIADIGSAVSAYLRSLGQAVERGHYEVRRARTDARAVLLAVLMGRHDERPVAELAERAGWDVPDHVVVLVAERRGAEAWADPGTGPHVLLRPEGDRLVAVCAPACAPATREALLALDRVSLVAEAWPVPPTEARHGYRWARRALALARERQVVPVGRVVRCAEHRLDLWVNADQALAAATSAELLAPLLRETPANRRALAATLLRMLETRQSAPEIARQLGTHAQTIRHRRRKLEAMFEDRLTDPRHTMGFILALRTLFPDLRGA
ncbi:MAG TPA: helix-turn-helix domain-containing protein [Nocardioides sp.]|uniref:helix-turn-helix domain-containing protein n=1 Tax=Nocardioides sp. TaxID=35761 RepID=UPI002ED7ED04